jgi:exosome complex RNA-binding protein Rrp42 (RNase PH superfamily)
MLKGDVMSNDVFCVRADVEVIESDSSCTSLTEEMASAAALLSASR